jgi:hypothetical protein
MARTVDGGYVIVGHTWSFGAGWSDVWLIKTDASGDTIWTRTYGGASHDGGYSVAQTADGGYVIAGYTKSFGAGREDVWLIKTDASGDTIWTRTVGGTDRDEGWSVAQTADSGYIIAGRTKSCGAGDYDVWLVKTDAFGNTIWTRTFGGTGYDRGYSVLQTTDGGYITTGYTESFGAGSKNAYLVKTDASGDTMWTRAFGGTSGGCGYSVAQTADGGYVITGYTWSFGGSYDVWLIKTDASGDTIWTRTYGGAENDNGYSVVQILDGGYVIAGWTCSFGAGNNDVWLIKTDASGDTMWTRTHGGARCDYGRSVTQTVDGGYVIVGHTSSYRASYYSDFWLIKTDADGRVAIAEPQPPVAHKPVGATIARAVLHVPETEMTNAQYPMTLLDVAGRRVMDLQPGENDVRHLSPGVYFVQGEPAARPTKVIIQR